MTKDYLRATAQIEVNLGGNDEETELPSHEQLEWHTPKQEAMKPRMDISNAHSSFSDSRTDRSDLGMSNASSIGLPGLGTLRAGINLPNPSKNPQQNSYQSP